MTDSCIAGKTCPKSRCAGVEGVLDEEEDILKCGEFWIVYCLDFFSLKLLDLLHLLELLEPVKLKRKTR